MADNMDPREAMQKIIEQMSSGGVPFSASTTTANGFAGAAPATPPSSTGAGAGFQPPPIPQPAPSPASSTGETPGKFKRMMAYLGDKELGAASDKWYTKEQALNYGRDEKGEVPVGWSKFVEGAGTKVGNKILFPKTEIQGKANNINSRASVSAREGVADSLRKRTDLQEQWQIYNMVNALDAKSGGVLGQAANVKFRSMRGMDLLENPNITQDKVVYDLIKSDLASIAQGGAPNIETAKSAEYQTLKKGASELMQYLASKPEAIDTPEIKNQIGTIFTSMARLSDGVINANTGIVGALKKGWIKEHPDQWNEVLGYLSQGLKMPTPDDLRDPNAPPSVNPPFVPRPGGGATPMPRPAPTPKPPVMPRTTITRKPGQRPSLEDIFGR